MQGVKGRGKGDPIFQELVHVLSNILMTKGQGREVKKGGKSQARGQEITRRASRGKVRGRPSSSSLHCSSTRARTHSSLLPSMPLAASLRSSTSRLSTDGTARANRVTAPCNTSTRLSGQKLGC